MTEKVNTVVDYSKPVHTLTILEEKLLASMYTIYVLFVQVSRCFNYVKMN